MALNSEAYDERAMRERELRPVVRLVASREDGVRCDDGGAESTHAGQDDTRVEGGAERGRGTLPQESPLKPSTPRMTIGLVMEAVDLYAADVVGFNAALHRREDMTIPQAKMSASYRVVVNRVSKLMEQSR